MTRRDLIELIVEAAPRINVRHNKPEPLKSYNDRRRVKNLARVITPDYNEQPSFEKLSKRVPATSKFGGAGAEAVVMIDRPTQSPGGHRAYRISPSPPERGVYKRPKHPMITQALATKRSGKHQVEVLPRMNMGFRTNPKGGNAAAHINYELLKSGLLATDVHQGNVGAHPVTKQAQLVDPGLVHKLTPQGKARLREYFMTHDPGKMSSEQFRHGMASHLYDTGNVKKMGRLDNRRNIGELNWDNAHKDQKNAPPNSPPRPSISHLSITPIGTSTVASVQRRHAERKAVNQDTRQLRVHARNFRKKHDIAREALKTTDIVNMVKAARNQPGPKPGSTFSPKTPRDSSLPF